MTSVLRAVALACVMSACSLSHTVAEDATGLDPDETTEDASADSPAGDGGTRVPLRGDGPACGPNVCRRGEVCCLPRCGICAVEAECPDYACPDPAAGRP